MVTLLSSYSSGIVSASTDLMVLPMVASSEAAGQSIDLSLITESMNSV
jgi:hypothetical protein